MGKSGAEFRTGDVVRISGAYFKNDNGLYFVSRSPGDPNYCGRDYTLRKIGKTGKISRARGGNVGFWPVLCFVNDAWKKAVANDWNAENAKIERATVVKTDGIAGYFDSRAAEDDIMLDYFRENGWDENDPDVKRVSASAEFYRAVAARVRAAA